MNADTSDPFGRAVDSGVSILRAEVPGIANVIPELPILTEEGEVMQALRERPSNRLHFWACSCGPVLAADLTSMGKLTIEFRVWGYLAATKSGSYREHTTRAIRAVMALHRHLYFGEDSGIDVADPPQMPNGIEPAQFKGYDVWLARINVPLNVIAALNGVP